ncbi:thiol-activated cytolysin family protein [Pseudooceanicola nanhaiensis]|uniref:thiol-activated cytolysin family protein n=1 Tax=Pseudooceanicola nanhaiensis TaxID=375761 RepID=UPI001CD63B21|nr:thiol-activated cytolysin family protein [Pseudooceanicola nanhaiensis]MCA0920126.1 thiol-activated cytolysin family protein [Pseudooceanicola nanhaiensis]
MITLGPYEVLDDRRFVGEKLGTRAGLQSTAECAAVCSADRSCEGFSKLTNGTCELWGDARFAPEKAPEIVSGRVRSVALTDNRSAPKPKRDPLAKPTRTATKDMLCVTRSARISDSFENHYVGRKPALDTALWPGALFYMDDVTTGSFAGVSNPSRQNLTILARFNERTSGTGSSAEPFVPNDPQAHKVPQLSYTTGGTLEEVNQAMQKIVADNSRNGSIDTDFNTFEVTSDVQLNLALKGGGSYNGLEMSTEFGFSSNENTHKQVAQLLQKYYSLSVDRSQIDPGLQGWIDDPEAAANIAALQADKGPLVYVETVVYGRAIYFSLEHSRSDVEVDAALNAVYESKTVSASADLKSQYKKALGTERMHVVSIGGTSEDGVINSLDEFKEMVGKPTGPVGLGAPIAYVLRFVENHELAVVNVATEYPQRDCVRLRNKIRFDVPYITVDVADDEGSGANNAIEVEALAFVRAEYDTYPSDDPNQPVVRKTPWKKLHIGNAAEGGEFPLGREGFVPVGRNVDFEVPDDPVTKDENEALTARIRVVWGQGAALFGEDMQNPGALTSGKPEMPLGFVYEIDNGRTHPTNSDDMMLGKNAQDTEREVTLNGFKLLPNQEGRPAEQYPSFAFQGGGNAIRIHYNLTSVD